MADTSAPTRCIAIQLRKPELNRHPSATNQKGPEVLRYRRDPENPTAIARAWAVRTTRAWSSRAPGHYLPVAVGGSPAQVPGSPTRGCAGGWHRLARAGEPVSSSGAGPAVRITHPMSLSMRPASLRHASSAGSAPRAVDPAGWPGQNHSAAAARMPAARIAMIHRFTATASMRERGSRDRACHPRARSVADTAPPVPWRRTRPAVQRTRGMFAIPDTPGLARAYRPGPDRSARGRAGRESGACRGRAQGRSGCG